MGLLIFVYVMGSVLFTGLNLAIGLEKGNFTMEKACFIAAAWPWWLYQQAKRGYAAYKKENE